MKLQKYRDWERETGTKTIWEENIEGTKLQRNIITEKLEETKNKEELKEKVHKLGEIVQNYGKWGTKILETMQEKLRRYKFY